MAGIGAYTKVEGFAFIPITSFSMALTTFVSQNLGAGESGRVKKGVRFGMLAGILMAVIIGVLMDVFATQLVAAFDSNPEVVAFGDGQNDASMLAAAGMGVAMGNAVKEARDAADMITATNNEDGIARALEKLLP